MPGLWLLPRLTTVAIWLWRNYGGCPSPLPRSHHASFLPDPLEVSGHTLDKPCTLGTFEPSRKPTAPLNTGYNFYQQENPVS